MFAIPNLELRRKVIAASRACEEAFRDSELERAEELRRQIWKDPRKNRLSSAVSASAYGALSVWVCGREFGLIAAVAAMVPSIVFGIVILLETEERTRNEVACAREMLQETQEAFDDGSLYFSALKSSRETLTTEIVWPLSDAT